jgi:hypothetical protein
MAAMPSIAHADVIVLCQNLKGGDTPAPGSTNLGCTAAQGNSVTTENILFNAGFTTTGTTVTGVAQKSNTLFDFTSTQTVTVNNGQGGFATIDPTGTDVYIQNLSYYVAPTQPLGSTFNAFLDLDTNLDVGKDGSGSVQWTIDALTSGGVSEVFTTDIFALTAGANNFTFEAQPGEIITEVSYVATNVTDVTVEDVKQTSVTLGNTDAIPVPEPSSLLIYGIGVLGLIGFARGARGGKYRLYREA